MDNMEMDMDMDSMLGEAAGSGPGQGGNVEMEKLTYIEQTTRALQQLGLVIGVAFMVAFLFLMMIAAEKVWDMMEEKYRKAFGIRQEQEEDPAALVGTFKRYKN